MIIAGMDVSGRPNIGNHTYMSIVIGTEDIIKQTVNSIGHDNIHMSRIKKRKRQEDIISKIHFDRKNSLGLCIRIDRDTIINEFYNLMKNKIRKAELVCIFNKVLFELVQKRIDQYFQLSAY